MSEKPLMPKATAMWLVENTSLTFFQIAQFCGLHELEVQGIADEEVAIGIKAQNPINTGQLSRDEIEKGQKNPNYKIKIIKPKTIGEVKKQRKKPKYTPLSLRQDRPDAILWITRNHPELSDSQIIKLVGTTKPTIQAIKNRTHWNSANLTPKDPVALGICSQIDLDKAVLRAAKKIQNEKIKNQENHNNENEIIKPFENEQNK